MPLETSLEAPALNTNQIIELVRDLGKNKFAERASRYDIEASFPFENYSDLKDNGLLALCVPKEYGGMGASFKTYFHVAAEMGRYCGATALTYNMHTCSILWSGVLSESIKMSGDQRSEHEELKREHFRRIVEEGAIYSQPVSEGGQGPGVSVGRPYSTSAKKVAGGWIVNGKKVFASLSGAANYYGILCSEEKSNSTLADTLYIAVPANAEGVEVTGDWNPVGMRGTVSRTILFKNVFVEEKEMLLPKNTYFEVTKAWPHMFLTLAPTYVGIAQAAYDFTVKYVSGGFSPVEARFTPTIFKQIAVSEMYILLEQTKALFYTAVSEAKPFPSEDERRRLFATNYTIMENANEICRRAIKVCGGTSLLKIFPLERLYRDSICGSLMRPWTSERCLELIAQSIFPNDKK